MTKAFVMVDLDYVTDVDAEGQEPRRTVYTYNAGGMIETKTNANDKTTTYAYDTSGILMK